jgi:glycosyltransferase involved in cell wall biosynthesis
VSRALLSELFRRSRFVVFPTLFEGAGLPLLEAARAGKAIACSDIPPFREFGGRGPSYFDPNEPSSMATVLTRLWKDASERERSARETAEASAHLSWESCARGYRAIYRQVAGQSLSEADQDCLNDARNACLETANSFLQAVPS